MSLLEELGLTSMIKTPSPFQKYRRHRPLEDISNFDSPMLPNIKEEDSIGSAVAKTPCKSGVSIETTPRRRVIRSSNSSSKELKTPDESQPTSSTPLTSRRQPTPKVQKTILHNPFEVDLLSRLHLPMCSPNVFNIVVSPTKSLDEENFDWPIEDVSRIKPAAIEEFPEAQFTYIEDPETETRAQQTIDTFWKAEKHIVPSPWQDNKRSVPKILIEKPKTSSTVASQTTLSLPPILPPDLEAVLRPYFNNGDKIEEENDIDLSENEYDEEPPFLSQSGLRRKLMFKQEEILNINCPSSPIVSICSVKGLSRTEKDSNLLRSPTISPIKAGSTEGSPSVPLEELHCSQMSVDMNVQSNGHQMLMQINDETVSHAGWSIQRQTLYEDQTMDSVAHNLQLQSHDGLSTDHGYSTETSSLNFANHFHSRLPDFSLPAEPWVPHLGSSTPTSRDK